MPNELDETDSRYVNPEGRDVHVIDKKVAVTLDGMDKFMNIFLWILPLPIIGGLIYMARKAKAKAYLQQLQQKIQHSASTIDNYQEQRVMVLQNTAKLLDKAISLDKDTFTEIAKMRSGSVDDETRIAIAERLGSVEKSINVAFENYPDLKAHGEIQAAMQQNNQLQQLITAAREVYNDTVLRWNTEIFSLWAKKYVAAKAGYTTRIPFIASAEMKAASKAVFF